MATSFNELIIQILQNFTSIIPAPIVKDELNTISLHNTKGELMKVTPQSLIVAGKDMSYALKGGRITTKRIDKDKLSAFFNQLRSSILRLNHLGISYYSDNIDQDIAELKEHIKQTPFSLYSETSDAEDVYRWVFIGNKEKWDDPLFELVLNKPGSWEDLDLWVPHFQIDIDTSLSFEELEKISEQYFGKGFMKYKLVIEGQTYLGMGIVGEVDGTKLTLGLGPKIRETDYHRESLKKLLNT